MRFLGHFLQLIRQYLMEEVLPHKGSKVGLRAIITGNIFCKVNFEEPNSEGRYLKTFPDLLLSGFLFKNGKKLNHYIQGIYNTQYKLILGDNLNYVTFLSTIQVRPPRFVQILST